MTSEDNYQFRDKIVVITGGGSGIGKSLSQAFAREGAVVVVVDLRPCDDVARSLPNPQQIHRHSSFVCNVTDAKQIRTMIRDVKQKYGKIDIYCSNAGIMFPPPIDDNDDSVARHSDSQWDRILKVNLTSHVIASRELLPDWNKNNNGVFVMTASAAGLLTQIGDASYGVSKAASVSYAEHLAIAHGNTVKVHCLCPQAVDTPFVDPKLLSSNSAMTDGIVSPEFVADCTLKAIQSGQFWILPHPRVEDYVKRKANDHARWLRGMQRMRQALRKNKNSQGKELRSKL